jgi:hypothetical protein
MNVAPDIHGLVQIFRVAMGVEDVASRVNALQSISRGAKPRQSNITVQSHGGQRSNITVQSHGIQTLRRKATAVKHR